MAATWTKNNSTNAQAIAVPCASNPIACMLCSLAACNMATIIMQACNMADMRISPNADLIARNKAKDNEINVLTARNCYGF